MVVVMVVLLVLVVDDANGDPGRDARRGYLAAPNPTQDYCQRHAGQAWPSNHPTPLALTIFK